MQALVIRLYKTEKLGAPSLYTLSFNISQLKRTCLNHDVNMAKRVLEYNMTCKFDCTVVSFAI